MSTHSTISIQQEDGTLLSTTCHFDGYPDHMDKILRKHFQTPTKVQKLVKGGELRCVNSDGTKEYYEDGNRPTQYRNFGELQNELGSLGYHYIFVTTNRVKNEGGWI